MCLIYSAKFLFFYLNGVNKPVSGSIACSPEELLAVTVTHLKIGGETCCWNPHLDYIYRSDIVYAPEKMSFGCSFK